MSAPRYSFAPQPFHLLDGSPWPVVCSVIMLNFIIANASAFHGGSSLWALLSTVSLLTLRFLWFRDVDAEATFQGHHTLGVQNGLNRGFLRFLVSEIRVFVSVFWAFFHSSLSPSVELGSMWPPRGIEAIDFRELPLLNSVLLLSSGCSVTYAHHALINGNRPGAIYGMLVTIVLALIFTACQGYEYIRSSFTRSDSVYGTVFFGATGLHGFHVIVGTLRLATRALRMRNFHATRHHHVGLNSSILYWHRVDVVWLFLYAFVYYWASLLNSPIHELWL